MRGTMGGTAARAVRMWQHGAQRSRLEREGRQARLPNVCHALLIEQSLPRWAKRAPRPAQTRKQSRTSLPQRWRSSARSLSSRRAAGCAHAATGMSAALLWPNIAHCVCKDFMEPLCMPCAWQHEQWCTYKVQCMGRPSSSCCRADLAVVPRCT